MWGGGGEGERGAGSYCMQRVPVNDQTAHLPSMYVHICAFRTVWLINILKLAIFFLHKFKTIKCDVKCVLLE